MSAKRSPLWQYFIKDNCRNLQNLFKRCPNKWKRILKSICNAIHPDIYLKYLKSLKSSQAQQKFVESEEESLISSVTECDSVPSTNTSENSLMSKRVKEYRYYLL